jgi:hypothetical protein
LLQVAPPSIDRWIAYPVIVTPVTAVGAVQVRSTCVLPGVAVTDAGVPGPGSGVALTEPLLAPAPAAFDAATLKEYGVPFVRPVTAAVVPKTVTVPADGVTVTV